MRLHREQAKLTQQALGDFVGLSRTSITNIEKGRQHVALHQLFDIAEALGLSTAALLPAHHPDTGSARLSSRLPPDVDKDIVKWASNIAIDTEHDNEN